MNFLIVKDSNGFVRGWKDGNLFPYAPVEKLLNHARDYNPNGYAKTFVTQAKYPNCACAYFGNGTDIRLGSTKRLGQVVGLGKDVWPIFESYARML